MLAVFFWDPDRNFFVLPYLNHPVTWYGFLFAMGGLAAYLVIQQVLGKFLAPLDSPQKQKKIGAGCLEPLSFFVVIGLIVGARLGHVFFYEWAYYKQVPLAIFKIWEGGLASHGGLLGMVAGLALFYSLYKKKFPSFTFLSLTDSFFIAIPLTGSFIRIGNFINQEINGIPTSLPWGVIFGHPIQGLPGIPVHPVQIYEALFYLTEFVILWGIWKKTPRTIGSGLLTSLFLILTAFFRFGIEFIKRVESDWISSSQPLWSMGQILTIPFALLGIGLVIRWKIKTKGFLPS